MCATVCLFYAPLGCGIHSVPPQEYIWRHGIEQEIESEQMGHKTESKSILADSHVFTSFICVMFSMQSYVRANAILFVAEGLQN